MVIYETFSDVPYSVWSQGGDVKIRDINSIPAPILQQKAIGVIPVQTTTGTGQQPTGGWLWWLIPVIIAGVVFAAIYRATILETFVVLRSAPEGTLEDLPGGNRLYTSPDGSTWLYDATTGEMTQLGGPTTVTAVIVVVTVLVIIITLAVIFLRVSKRKKTKGEI